MPTVLPVRQEIERVVSEEWRRPYGGPLLISKLGMRLSPESKTAIAASGFGLKRYVQEHLSDVIRFVPMRARGGGVAPLNDVGGLSDQDIEARYVDRAEQQDIQSVVPMYWGAIWRGFQTPLTEGDVRYVLFEAHGSPEVGNSPADAPLPANAKLIDPNDLVLPLADGSLPPRITVHHSIENWCRREGVPVANLLFTRSPSKRGESDASASGHGARLRSKNDNGTSLAPGFDLLTREELGRINIPADLVLSMLERAGRL